MKFLVDAQLPKRLSGALTQAGHDAFHTAELTLGNRTPDPNIATLADRDGRVVVTKDSDFVTSHLLHGTPGKLLLISTGNISNNELLQLVKANLPAIEAALREHSFVELTRSALTIHA